jgi:hypothetical protein
MALSIRLGGRREKEGIKNSKLEIAKCSSVVKGNGIIRIGGRKEEGEVNFKIQN